MTKDFNIHNEPCDCPPGQCAHFLDNDAACINRLSGDVRVLSCETCGGCGTWHQDRKCLKCGTVAP